MYICIYSLVITNFSEDLYDSTELMLAELALSFSISPFKVYYSLLSSLFRASATGGRKWIKDS